VSSVVLMAAVDVKSQSGPRHGIHRITRTRFADLSTVVRISVKILAMNNYQFTLILSGVAEITPELADSLFTATGGDIELNMRNDVAYIDFHREADTLHDAVSSAIAQVEGAGVGVRVVRVESDAANTIAKINADLLGVASAK
jgi:hypothetical protein